MNESETPPATPRPARQPRLRRELVLFGIMLCVGLLLPIYLTGQALLGDYTDSGGGLAQLYGDILGDLVAGTPFAWLLILGPWLGVSLLRLLWWPLGRGSRQPAHDASQHGA